MKQKQIYLIALIVILLISAHVGAQEVETTPDPLAVITTATPSPTFTETLFVYSTASPTPTETPRPLTTEALTPEITAEITDAATVAPLVTAEITAESSATATPTPESTEVLPATPEVTTELPLTPESTSGLLTPEITSEPTLLPTPELTAVTGTAQYQSRQPDHSGIQISIVDSSGVMLSTVLTDATGTYTALVPPEQPFFLVVTAPLHRRVQAIIPPGATLPLVTLAGGDLNQDGCIGLTDISLLTAQFDTTETTADINGDGLTEAADLAILAGNFESGCETPPATLTPETTTEPTAEVTPEMTLSPEPTSETTPTAMPTLSDSDLLSEPGITPIATESS